VDMPEFCPHLQKVFSWQRGRRNSTNGARVFGLFFGAVLNILTDDGFEDALCVRISSSIGVLPLRNKLKFSTGFN